MGSGFVMASDRVEFLASDTVCAIAAYVLAHPARYFDLLSRYRLSFLGNIAVSRAAGFTLAVEYTGSIS